MRNKVVILLILLVTRSVIVANYKQVATGALFIIPIDHTYMSASLSQLDKIGEDSFILSYLTAREAVVTSVGANYSITLKGTNQYFHHASGYKMVNGGFFSDEMPHAVVVNEAAAFNIFGSVNVSGNELTVNGSTRLVSGVIRDGSKSSNLYVPISADEAPAEFILSPDSAVSVTQIKNKLKNLGITDDKYHFVDSAMIAELMSNYEFEILVAFFLIIMLARLQLQLTECVRKIKATLKSVYIGRLFSENKVLFLKTVGVSLTIAVGVCGLVTIAADILGKLLHWSEVYSACYGIYSIAFQEHLSAIGWLYQLSNIILVLCVAVLVYTSFFSNKYNPPKKNTAP